MDISDFYTVKDSNDGIEIPLTDPRTGELTEHTIRIRSCESDEYQAAKIRYQRKRFAQSLEQDEAKAIKIEIESQRELASSLVIDWSFEPDCTPEEVLKLFKNAPHIQDALERIAGDRNLFFMLKRVDSNTTQESKPS